MRAVSEQVRLPRQVVALRSTAFALVHRKAIFEYLRDRHVTGPRRHRVFALFYGIRDYGNAVLAEHGNYVRCSSSYLCTYHLAEHLMQDEMVGTQVAQIGRAHAELQSHLNLVCRLLLEKKKHNY